MASAPAAAGEAGIGAAKSRRSRWDLYRARNGRLYAHEPRSGATRWDAAPEGEETSELPVNDVESWECYRWRPPKGSTVAPRVYFVNTQTGETTWQTPPGCAGKQPVNDPDSWLEFTDPTRGRSFYFNKMSHEKTWHRPLLLGPAPDDEEPLSEFIERLRQEKEREEEANNLVDDDGDEFFIPEGFSDEDGDEDEDEGADANVETTAARSSANPGGQAADGSAGAEECPVGSTRNPPSALAEDDDADEVAAEIARERARNAALEQQRESSREAYLVKQRRLFSKDFTDMLEEKGIQPHSQWSNWVPKLEFDERFTRVDVEDRARIFNEYRISLIGNERSVRKDRARRCLRLLNKLRKHVPGLGSMLLRAGSTANSAEGRVAALLAGLRNAARGGRPADEDDAEKGTELNSFEQARARRALLALEILVPVDQRAVVATFLGS